MKVLTGSWMTVDNYLVVNHRVIGRLLSLRMGRHLVALIRKSDSTVIRYELQPEDFSGTLLEFANTQRDFAPMVLKTVSWAPLTTWQYRESPNGDRLCGTDVHGNRVTSSVIMGVRKGSCLTYSQRRDVWEVVPVLGTHEQVTALLEKAISRGVPTTPLATEVYLRHCKRT